MEYDTMNKSNKQPLPVKKKSNKSTFLDNTGFINELSVPNDIVEAANRAGISLRLVSRKRVLSNGGRHPRGWQVVNLKDLGITRTNSLSNSVESTYEIGDLVLAAKPVEQHNAHKSYLKQKADLSSKAVISAEKEAAKKLKEQIRAGGASESIRIIEGYEANK